MEKFIKMTVSYIDSSRRLRLGHGCKYVQNRRPGNCVWNGCKRGLWGCVLDNNFILTKKLAAWQAFLLYRFITTSIHFLCFL